MMLRCATEFAVVVCVVGLIGCGGSQRTPRKIETRPLEETKALAIIGEVLAERGYAFQTDVPVLVARSAALGADIRVSGERLAIEYLTKLDRAAVGELPPPGEGSRLHVVSGQTAASAGGVPSRVYILFIDDRNFVYHANPTSEVRADVTFLEVDSRLRRDVSDFLGWYEESGKR